VTTGFDTSLNGTRSLFHATAVARWGMRDHNRIYTDALGEANSSGATYIEMMRYNVRTIVTALTGKK
jgi:ABC-type Zn uptake system ZnuABC Zn-binding protein ZnuA